MRILLAYKSGEPIYEQIKEQIKAAILSGELPNDELLPSIRQLAKELKVSVITTTRAYNDLELEGFLQTVPGKGCYVKKIDNALVRAKYAAETREKLAEALRLGKNAGFTKTDLHNILDELEDA